MMLKLMTDEETRAHYRKKYYELSLKSVGEIAQVEEPTYEQKAWVLRRLKDPSWAWERCC
jgi:hypothetical protein